MSTRGAIGADSCRMGADNRDEGLGRLAAFSAINALQSTSVRGSRGESAGVRGEGELGLEPVTDPFLETVGEISTLRSWKNSALVRGDR
jgi:hypothetical protein